MRVIIKVRIIFPTLILGNIHTSEQERVEKETMNILLYTHT